MSKQFTRRVYKLERDKVEMLRDPEQTDELRRLALQLALQLPASVSDARKVLAMTSECLDDFLIEKAEAGSAAARASRLWRPRLVEAAPPPVPIETPRLAVLFCCLGVLAVAIVLGAVTTHLVGYGALGSSVLGVTVIALLFGRGAALMSAALAFLLINWAVIPPVWNLQAPTAYELCGAVMYFLTAVIVPWIQARREPLRTVSLRIASKPLRVFLRRAA